MNVLRPTPEELLKLIGDITIAGVRTVDVVPRIAVEPPRRDGDKVVVALSLKRPESGFMAVIGYAYTDREFGDVALDGRSMPTRRILLAVESLVREYPHLPVEGEAVAPPVAPSQHYPHTCPGCGAPTYVPQIGRAYCSGGCP